MNISRIDTHAGQSARTPNAGAHRGGSASFASVLAAARGDAQPIDFTHMTRKDLTDWVNAGIKRGELSLDGSEVFVAMTLKMPVNGAYTGLDDTEKVDFIQSARDGMAWARQHENLKLLKGLEAALRIMRQYQGRPGSAHPSA